jgi:hypothetical protein
MVVSAGAAGIRKFPNPESFQSKGRTGKVKGDEIQAD